MSSRATGLKKTVSVIAIHELDNEQAYEAEVSQCVGATGYHHWFFLTAIAEACDLKFRAYAVESAGQPLGVVPLLFRRRGPVTTVNYLPVGCIGPLLRGEALRAGRVREMVSAVEPVLRKHLAAVTVWEFSPGIAISDEYLAMPGYEVSKAESYIIPRTKSADDCWKAMSQLRRRSIRRCKSLGISVTDSTVEEITQWVPGQISGVYEHQGVWGSYRLSEAKTITERLATHPRMLWRTTKTADGEVLAVSGNIITDERLDNWLMTGPHLPRVSAHSLAYWDLMNWALPRGLTIDFGGAPNDGNRSFKISASCEVSTGYVVSRVRYKAAYDMGRAIYNWASSRRMARKHAVSTSTAQETTDHAEPVEASK
jgi:hypothetical protein